jgi:hypothetical protein
MDDGTEAFRMKQKRFLSALLSLLLIGSLVPAAQAGDINKVSPIMLFQDIPQGAYYWDAVSWALENGVTEGVDLYHFDPDGVCTRGQIVTFLWRAAGSPAPASYQSPFADVTANAYYYEAVLWAYEQGIVTLDDGSLFRPALPCTRALTVTYLWRYTGALVAKTRSSISFTDVPETSACYDAVSWAVEQGITSGTSDTTFSPRAVVTRCQAVTFLFRNLRAA